MCFTPQKLLLKLVVKFNVSLLVCLFVWEILNSEHFFNYLEHLMKILAMLLRIIKETHKGHYEISMLCSLYSQRSSYLFLNPFQFSNISQEKVK